MSAMALGTWQIVTQRISHWVWPAAKTICTTHSCPHVLLDTPAPLQDACVGHSHSAATHVLAFAVGIRKLVALRRRPQRLGVDKGLGDADEKKGQQGVRM